MDIKREQWSREKIIKIAKNYSTKHDFLTDEPKAYDAAVRRNMLEELTWLDGRISLTYKVVEDRARKYKTIKDFRKKDGASYAKALSEGWIKNFSWLNKAKRSYWSYDEVKSEALKYTTAKEFRKNSALAYRAATKHKWISDFTWLNDINISYESIEAVAKGYHSLNKFKASHWSLYNIAKKNGWLDKFDWLKKSEIHSAGYWTYNRIENLALSCKTKKELREISRTAYQKARDLGWLDKFDWLVDTRFNIFTDPVDSIYAYEFVESKSVYVGRTLMVRQTKRDEEHKTKESDSVYIFAKVNNLSVPNMIILESNLLLKDGVEKEGEWVEIYKSKGWNIINKTKTGSIGSLGKGKRTYSAAKEEASKYTTLSEFRKNNRSLYDKARDSGWLKDFTWLVKDHRPPCYWSYENVKQEAQKYHLKSEFKKSCSAAYEVARENKWLDEFFPKNVTKDD